MTIFRLSALVIVVVVVGVVLTPAVGARQQEPGVLLRAAIEKEDAAGDLEGAMALYRQIITANGRNRAVTARALLRLAGCYEKLGQAEAERTYRQLINDYADQTAEVAAARTRLAALARPVPQASTLPTLRLVARISRANAPPSGSISPDGRLLAHVNWDTGDLAMRDLRSGQSRMVTSKGGNWQTSDSAFMPRWSPDGKQLAYYWYREDGGLHELRLTDLSGKNVRVLFSDQRRGLFPVGWFPDATALLAVSLREAYATEILRVSLDDARVTPLAKLASVGSSRVGLSPNGRYVAFDMPPDLGPVNMDVFVMPSSGGRAVPVVTGPYDDRLLDWAPDGRRVLVASNRSGTYDAFLIDVDNGNPAGSPQLLRKDLGLVTPLGFAPDGAFYFVPDIAVHDVMVVDWNPDSQRAASAPRPATEHFSGATRLPAWSPDGRMLAYVVDRGNFRRAETRVRIRDVATTAERTLAEISGSVYSLSWSPDGTSVAMTVRSGPDRTILCQILDVNSGEVIREIASPRRSIPRFQWAPNGGVVYYNSLDANSTVLMRRGLHAADETLLYTGAGNAPMAFVVSPDGQHLAVVGRGGIFIIPTSGGEPRELVRLEPPGGRASELAWSRDSNSLYFGRPEKGRISLHRVALAGGAPEDLGIDIGPELRFSPDGRHLAFTRSGGQKVAEVWVMENFLPAAEGAR